MLFEKKTDLKYEYRFKKYFLKPEVQNLPVTNGVQKYSFFCSQKKYVSLILSRRETLFCLLFFSPLDFLQLSLTLFILFTLTRTHTRTHNPLILHHSTGKTNQTYVVGQRQSDIPTKIQKIENLNIMPFYEKKSRFLWDYNSFKLKHLNVGLFPRSQKFLIYLKNQNLMTIFCSLRSAVIILN